MDVNEEGPPPPFGSPRSRTGAEKMNDNQDEYENRVPKEDNRVEKVHQHNAAHPRLLDELAKRRSTTDIRIKPLQLADPKRFDPKCKACRRQRALARLRKYDIKPRCENAEARENAMAARSKRISRYDAPRRTRGICKCQCGESRARPLLVASDQDFRCFLLQGREAQYARKHYSPVSNFSRTKIMRLMSTDAENRKKQSKRKEWKEETVSETSLNSKNAPESDRSRSSYRSFGSMNDEPMV